MKLKSVSRLYESFVKMLEAVVALLVGLMVIAVSCNVIARYFLKVGLIWAEEFSMLLFIWVVFLGAYIALRGKAHLALTFIVRRLPRKVRRIQRLIVLVLVGVFLAVVTIGGWQLVSGVIALDQRTALLRISSAWSLASVPVSAALMLIEVIMILLRGDDITAIETMNQEGEH